LKKSDSKSVILTYAISGLEVVNSTNDMR